MKANPHEEIHQRALDRFKLMSAEQRIALLKRAGILDEHGHLAERYRPPESSAGPRGGSSHRTPDAR